MPMTTDGLIGGGLTVGGSVRPAQCRQVLQREGGGGVRDCQSSATRSWGLPAGSIAVAPRRLRFPASTPMDMPARACVSTCE